MSQISFHLGDLRSHRNPMRCVIGNRPCVRSIFFLGGAGVVDGKRVVLKDV